MPLNSVLTRQSVHNKLTIIIVIRRMQISVSPPYYWHKKRNLGKFIIYLLRICGTGELHRRLSSAETKIKFAFILKKFKDRWVQALLWQEERKYNGN